MLVTCPQNTINAANYQAASQQASQVQVQFSLPEPSMEQEILANSPILNALDTRAPSCLDIPPTSSTHSDDPDDPKLATKLYSCNTRLRYSYSTMSTRSISSIASPGRTRKKIMSHHLASHIAFGYVSLSNFLYVDPPLSQPHCLNLPPSRAKKKGVYSYYSI
jgi:hypothetical protein